MVSCKTEIKENEAAKLDTIISEYQDHKGYDEKAFPLGVFTESYFQKEADFAQRKLDILRHIDSTRLSESGQISLALLKFQLQEAVDYNRFKMYLNPILSDAGFHASLPYMVRPLTNYQQVKEYLNKLNAIPRYVDENLVLIREGLKNGVSQPQVIFKGYESTYDTHIVDDYRDSFFYTPFKNLPNSLSAQQRDSVLVAAKESVENNVTPQFKRIKTFFETVYLPGTRTSIGVSETPDGSTYYQNRIDYYTTSMAYTAEDIHQIGLNEVARIKAEMQSVIDSVGFKGSFADFLQFLRTDKQFYAKTPRELLMIARDIAKRIDAQLPRFFITLPRKPYGVAPVPASIAPKYTGGRYIESARSTDPGYFWVNTYDLPSRPLYTLPPLAAHEAVPGHHLQISLNNELGDSIPQFRRNLYLSAYGEGWGLYSEYLADEMGIYTTPYEKFGQLTYEMWRACRLVVDTGIHAKGWTRQQAIDYMAGNTALSMHEVNTEIDRYISWPGQALSYKMGELKIRELRKKAEDELGAKFDIRDFHEVILGQGTVTLPLLEKLVNKYIDTVKNG
ncbi:MAG: DUF885 domain-containing protein [Flavobacteriaceae bacterium]|nr:DUF885 domain-containing protein [Flavobacteriaceae bacterium]